MGYPYSVQTDDSSDPQNMIRDSRSDRGHYLNPLVDLKTVSVAMING
jgi:hypothetical protein